MIMIVIMILIMTIVMTMIPTQKKQGQQSNNNMYIYIYIYVLYNRAKVFNGVSDHLPFWALGTVSASVSPRYFGSLSLGERRKFKVSFDTGSANVVLPCEPRQGPKLKSLGGVTAAGGRR